MNMPIALAVLVLQGAVPMATPAPQWELFYSDSDGNYEVDPARLSREGDAVDAWVRLTYAAPSELGMHTFVLHNRVDCRRRRAVTYSMEGFIEDGTSMGQVNYAEHERPNERVSRRGGDGAMLRRLCGGAAE